ncbi:MAG: phosphonate ABC transporter, permease protein PhnE [Sphaerochaetaceae bacterium]
MVLTVAEKLSQEPKLWRKQLLIVLMLVIVLGWSLSAITLNTGGASGWSVAKNIFKGLVTPTPSLLFNLSSNGVAYLLLETVCIAFLGTLVGAVVAVPISFLSASNIVPSFIAIIGRVVIMAIRTIPAFVYGLMFIMVTGPGPFAGLLTMSLASVGMLSKMFIETIEDLDRGIIESLDAAGCTLFQKIRYGIVPQLSASFLSTLIYRFDMNLRDATVLGLVGAGGIGAPLIFAMSSYRWSDAGAVLVGLIILVLFVEWFSNTLRKKLARG